MSDKKQIAVILAAGMGTRMKSQHPKAMQQLCYQPMITHLLQSIDSLFDKIVVVIGADMDELAQICAPHETIIQNERKGTGHAALIAVNQLAQEEGDVTFLYADNPLITQETLKKLLKTKEEGADASLLTMRPQYASHYGRVVTNQLGHVTRIVEYKDATEEERLITLCNAGTICISLKEARKLLERVTPHNAQGEYYLTDIIGFAAESGTIIAIEAHEEEVIGINTRAELARAEYLLQERLRKKALDAGVTLVDPASTFLSVDTKFEEDVILEPHIVIGPGVSIGKNALIRAFSHLEGCSIENSAIIGPYARLRPGTKCQAGSHVGNFVELKNTTLGEGSKANHLTYLGDTHIEKNVNIGAGTITCNYDGIFKHKTYIEEGSFIGSDTILVAPLHVGKESIIAAGSVITKDVSAGALVFGRAQQKEKVGRGISYRENLKRKKEQN